MDSPTLHEKAGISKFTHEKRLVTRQTGRGEEDPYSLNPFQVHSFRVRLRGCDSLEVFGIKDCTGLDRSLGLNLAPHHHDSLLFDEIRVKFEPHTESKSCWLFTCQGFCHLNGPRLQISNVTTNRFNLEETHDRTIVGFLCDMFKDFWLNGRNLQKENSCSSTTINDWNHETSVR